MSSDRDDDEEDAVDSVEATRSGRPIKRRRFDDEIVESSLGGSGALLPAGAVTTPRGGTAAGVSGPIASAAAATTTTPHSTSTAAASAGAAAAGSSSSSNSNNSISSCSAATSTTTSVTMTGAPLHSACSTASAHTKDDPGVGRTASTPQSPSDDAAMGGGECTQIPSGGAQADPSALEFSDEEPDEWRASDDLLLISAVVQTRDLELVHKGVKFSYPFSLDQVTNRWRQLLYSEDASHLALEAIAGLHPSTVEYLERKTPFSAAEEAILAAIGPHQAPTQQKFQAILDANRKVFLPCRTAKHLLKHWQLLRQHFLLTDQHVPVAASEKGIPLNFSDVEEEYNDPQNDTQLRRRRDLDIDYEQRQLHRSARREMKRLEAELPLWQGLTESITGTHGQDFDDQTLAVLRGRLVRYLMRSKEISLGRSSRDTTVDIDFSLEGPAYKVSRRQAIIKLRTNGEFVFANEGKRPVYIDGTPVLTGNKCRLNHNSVVELAGLRFVFLVNMKLINSGQADLIQ